ncbi:MAG: T9SS type A sorting domain-containing protein, partial [Saprospiraceae bacterium]
TLPPECGFDRDFNGTFYSYTMDGFVSRIDFDSSGFQGLSFTVAFGDSGPGNTGDVIEDRRSVNNADATSGAADHQIFLNDPDTCAYPTDTSQCGEVFLLSVSCEDPDSFCINIAVTEMGQVEVILDFDTNGVYTMDSLDVILAMIFDSAGQACLPWDGLRGDSSEIPFGEDVPVIIRYSQGVQHYAAYDVEFLKNGFCVETVRPLCTSAATDILYWDDSEITDDVNTVTIDEGDPGTGQPRVQLNGCECQQDGCRTWDNFQIGDPPSSNCSGPPYGYGDNATLNTWWYARVVVIDGIFLPFVQVNISGDSAICDGDTTSFFANVEPDSVDFIFAWTGPGGFTASTQSTGPIGLEGTYYVTVTDTITECSAIDSMALIVFDNPTTTITFTCVGPNQQNANVDLTVSGGLPPYMYLWSNGETTQDLTNVPPGTYTVVVTDANGCMAFDTVTVSGCCELIITCGPTNAGTFTCIDDVPPSTSTGIVLVEFCDDTTTVTVETDNGGAGCPGDTLIITRVHTVTDGAGNVSTCTQVFTVIDNVPPALTEAVNDTSIICGASISPDVTGLPTFTDNCSDVILTFSDDSTGFDGTCTNDVIGVVVRTFSATDECGNTNSSFTQSISIIDTIPPTFTVSADITIDCADDISPANTGIITDTTDNCLGPVTLTFTDLVLAGVCPTTDS